MKLSIIVPCYNEEKTIIKILERLQQIDKKNFEIEIIVINDCSVDQTLKLLEENKQLYNILLNNSKNSGKGFSVKRGMQEASGEYIFFQDADLEYDPVDLKELKRLSMQHPNSLILGSRFIGEKERKNLYLRTYLANKVMSLFFSIVNLYTITDVATCYKLMPSKFVKGVTLQEQGFSIEIELLSKFLKYNKSVVESPISYEGRSYEEGKKIKTTDGVFYLLNTLKYRFF